MLAQMVAGNPQAAASAIENWLRLNNIPDKQAWLGPLQQMMQQQAQQEQQLQLAKEQAIGQRESQGRQESMIADVVKQVLAAQHAQQTALAAPQKATA